METNRNYEEIARPYNVFFERSNDLSIGEATKAPTPSTGGVGNGSSSSQPSYNGGSFKANGNVEKQPVKSDGAIGDVWIRNFIRSIDWKPKKVGFYIDGLTGYAEFTNVFVSGHIQALTGKIGGFTIGATNLSVANGNNSTILSSGTIAFAAGPTGAPTVTISQTGLLTATAGSIGGWIINNRILASSGSGSRIELNPTQSRISIFNTSSSEVVVMGYLDGLAKHDGSGYWESDNYGFWAKQGDMLSIDGDAEYISGDWIVKDDGSYLINDSEDNTVVRLGTYNQEKGLFIYDMSGNNIAKYTSSGILVGNSETNLTYTTQNGLIISNQFTAAEDIQAGSPVMLLKDGTIARASGASGITAVAPLDRLIGFTREVVLDGGTTSIQQSGIFLNNLSFESQKTNGNSGAGMYGTTQQGQTFTPTIAMNCSGVNLNLFKVGVPPADVITVSIKATSAGLPTGADLTSGTFSPTLITSNDTILNITFSSTIALNAGTVYAIVLSTTSGVGDSSNCIGWYITSSSVYSAGQAVLSSNYGTSWSAYSTPARDFYFEIIGNVIDFVPGSMYEVDRSYSSETITIDQTTRNQTTDANNIVEQTFITLETFLSRISLYLTAGAAGAGTYTLNMKIYDEDSVLLMDHDYSAAVTGSEAFLALYVDDSFNGSGNRLLVCPGKTYRIRLYCAVATQILIGYQDSAAYSGGSLTIAAVNYPTYDLGFRLREVYGSGSLTEVNASGNYESSSAVGIAIDTDKILLKSLPRWK